MIVSREVIQEAMEKPGINHRDRTDKNEPAGTETSAVYDADPRRINRWRMTDEFN
jgi:hypothetical protein